MDKSQIKLSDLLRSFLLNQEDRNHSPRTVRWYADMLGRFLAFVGDDARVTDLTIELVRQYQHECREAEVSKFTRHAYARTVKTFLRWLEREEYIDRPLSTRLELPKVPKYQDVSVDVLREDEIVRLLDSFNINTDVGSRNRAIACLMLESGLRLREVVELHIEDVRLREQCVLVHGKGDREHYVPLGVTTQKALTRYAEHFRVPAQAGITHFFLNIYGEPLGYEAVKSTFDRLAKQAGIARLHPHLLRHTAATRMLEAGADIHSVQRLLRHTDIRTTLRYAHLAPAELKRQMDRFSPLGSLRRTRRRTWPPHAR